MTIKKTKSEQVSEFRRRRKLNLIKVCGNQCCLCGYNKSISALEFHHIYPELKEYGIASNGTCHNIQQDINEVKKCVLVCANCHREIHDNMYTEEELVSKQVFDEEVIKELTTYKSKEQYFCKECNTLIGYNTKTGLCLKCAAKLSRKCEHPDRDTLKELIRTLPFTKIGEIYGVSDNSVRKWCVQEGLPSRKQDINKIQDWSKI